MCTSKHPRLGGMADLPTIYYDSRTSDANWVSTLLRGKGIKGMYGWDTHQA